MSWVQVCNFNDISPDTGICALVNGEQVAVFRQSETDRLFAVGNFDPAGRANVLSRGLLAQLGDKVTVASPLYKHHFCLQTGNCLEDDSLSVPVYEVHHKDGKIEVRAR